MAKWSARLHNEQRFGSSPVKTQKYPNCLNIVLFVVKSSHVCQYNLSEVNECYCKAMIRYEEIS